MKKVILFILITAFILTGCSPEDKWQKQYDLGIRYLYEGNYEEAILAFNAAIEIDPKRTDVYIYLADTYIGMGELGQAADALSGALDTADDPDTMRQKLSDVQFEQGREHLDQGEYEAAADDFNASIENNALREEAYQNLADAYMGMGELDKVIEALQEGTNAVPNASSELMDRLSEMKELKNALETLTGYLEEEDLEALQGDDVKDMMSILNKYMDMCYIDGKLIKEYTGVGFKMLMESTIYYGDLVDGIPNGQGYSIFVSGPYDQYSGSWQFGKPNGSGSEITITDDQTIYDSGTYVDGLGDGTINRTINFSSGEYAVFVMTVSKGNVTDGVNPVEKSPGLSNVYWQNGKVFVYGFGVVE